jgi:hypothetical protein
LRWLRRWLHQRGQVDLAIRQVAGADAASDQLNRGDLQRALTQGRQVIVHGQPINMDGRLASAIGQIDAFQRELVK